MINKMRCRKETVGSQTEVRELSADALKLNRFENNIPGNTFLTLQ